MSRKKKGKGKGRGKGKGKGKGKKDNNQVYKKCSGGTMMAGEHLVKCHWHGSVDDNVLFCPACGKKL
jgi:hypothetical protein